MTYYLFRMYRIVDGAQSGRSQTPVHSSISFHIFLPEFFFIRADSHWQEKNVSKNFCIILTLPPDAGIQVIHSDTLSGILTSFDESYNIREG